MKNLILKLTTGIFVSLLFLTSCNSQKQGGIKGSGNIINETRNVGSFYRISVSGSFKVVLVSGNEGEIRIKIEDNLLPYLVTEVTNGNLKIKWKSGTNIRTRRKVDLTINFESLDAVSLSGSGDIESRDIIRSDNFEMGVSGSGDIDLNVEAENLIAGVSGSGDVDLKGFTKNFNGAVAGSGNIEAVDLKADKAILKISGSGKMTITVVNELVAKVAGSGNIKYKGNPKIEDIKISGSGNVRTY